MKKIILFFGVPGSGKGTQAKVLAEKFNYRHISTGDLFRELEKDPGANPEDIKAVQVMKTGDLVPSKLVYRLAFKAIEEGMKNNGGVVLDGAVRTMEQAKKFDEFFEKNKWKRKALAIVLRLSDEEAIRRLTSRKICSKCGEIITWDKKLDARVRCKKCGGELIVRTDDSPEAAQKRLQSQGNLVLAPILEYYKKSGRLAGVDGAQTIKKVGKDLNLILGHYYIWRLKRRVRKSIKFFKGGK